MPNERHAVENADQKIPRNKQWDLIRAVGIIAVVWGHNFQPPYLFFPPFYFHLALFFFASGYFFRPKITIKNKLQYSLKKVRSQLLPYFLLNIVFGLVTMLVRPMGIDLGSDLNLQTMFIVPFGRGDQFALYLAAWFVFNLFFVNILAIWIYRKSVKANVAFIALAFVLMLVSFKIGAAEDSSMWLTFICRSFVGFGFFSLGYLLRLVEPKIQQFIVEPINIVVLYVIVNFLEVNYGDLSQHILSSRVNNSIVIIPVISSISIILLVYIVAYYGAKVLKEGSLVYQIGRYSYAIMVWHFTFFFLVNTVLYFLSVIPLSALSNVYFRYDVEKLWLVYQLPAVIGPLVMVWGYGLIKQKFLKLAQKYLTPRYVALLPHADP